MRIRTALGVSLEIAAADVTISFRICFPSLCFSWWWGVMRFLVEREREREVEEEGIEREDEMEEEEEEKKEKKEEEKKEKGRKERKKGRKYTNRFRDGSREKIISLSLHLYNSICFFPLGDGELEKQAEEVDAALPHP
jgi:hypothetical protein